MMFADDNEIPTAPKSQEKCNNLSFADVCNRLNLAAMMKGSENKFLAVFTPELKAHLQEDSIYPLVRLLMPQVDKERGSYGLKEHMMATVLIDAFNLNKSKSTDALRLLGWQNPLQLGKTLRTHVLETDDFFTVVEDTVQSRITTTPSQCTVGDANNLLDTLAQALTIQEKKTIVREMLYRYSANEVKWLFRIIFLDLRIRWKHEQILIHLSSTAMERYQECTDIRAVCENLGSPNPGLCLFTAFLPMLAKGFPNQKIAQHITAEKRMNKQPFVMDIKIDGERIMMHVSKDRVKVCSRNDKATYTEKYRALGEDVRCHLLVEECILDGEVCAWSNVTRSFLPFGKNQEVGQHEVQRQNQWELLEQYDSDATDDGLTRNPKAYLRLSQWLVYIVFDVVYVQGEGTARMVVDACRKYETRCHEKSVNRRTCGTLVHYPLAVRRELLTKVVEFEDRRIELIRHRVVDSHDPVIRQRALDEYYQECIVRGEEGIVVKNLASVYVHGTEATRRLGFWVKMKPDYGGEVHDLDVVVLGAYYGLGDGTRLRRQGYSRFLFGVRSGLSSYTSLGAVSVGYTDQELIKIRALLEPVAKPWNGDKLPAHLQDLLRMTNPPHVWFPPEKSLVLEVRCANIVRTERGHFFCRFPRVYRVRFDKSVDQASTMEEVRRWLPKERDIMEAIVKDEMPLEIDLMQGEYSWNEQHDRRDNWKRPLVDSAFTAEIHPRQEIRGDLFKNKKFYVLGDDFRECGTTRRKLLFDIRSQQGTIVLVPEPGCYMVMSPRPTLHKQVWKRRCTEDPRYIVAHPYEISFLISRLPPPSII